MTIAVKLSDGAVLAELLPHADHEILADRFCIQERVDRNVL
ncbi:MAG: hypothetical protein ACI9C1_002873 [Candidatus Aldehydirespiratoraceae bacterium]|jgi:hypothetical protein